MNIQLQNIGKRFNKHWLFKSIDCSIQQNQTIAITGFNGSGKSTLLQIILGYQVPSTGKVTYSKNGHEISNEQFFEYSVIAAPYIELPEELTLLEVLNFHFSFKALKPGITYENMITQSGLSKSEHKQVKYFSSGMKQRLKLILAFFSVSDVLLLDEPTSNLDERGINWYRELLNREHRQRTIIIASNQPFEYELSDFTIAISQSQDQ